MLGLGDIVLPGIMIGLALRFDLWLYYLRKQTKTQKVVVGSDGEKQTSEAVEKAPYISPTGRWGDRFWTYTLPASALPTQLRSSFPKTVFHCIYDRLRTRHDYHTGNHECVSTCPTSAAVPGARSFGGVCGELD